LTLETVALPTGPYSLRLSARHASDATRTFHDGRLVAALAGERVEAWQRPDGAVHLRAETEGGLERLRFVLALHDDHSEFVRRFASDPLVGPALRSLRGLRPLRVGTVTHALLRALCGQLIDAKRARSIERAVVRRVSPPLDGLSAPPEAASFAALAPAELCRLGLSARKAATLVRACRELSPERLRDVEPDAAAARLGRERGLGPWSVGVIFLEGLGRYDRGLVGDLGLVRLLAARRGRPVEGWETAELLEPYGEWAGLASVYLLAGAAAGLLPSVAAA
jgi:3-methyladenine DNA glycosylase/8-oxoguanine DNA glycosylase